MEKFKFILGEKVFVLGLAGMVIVTGRGHFDFMSGGEMNMYQIQGAHNSYRCERELLSLKEAEELTTR